MGNQSNDFIRIYLGAKGAQLMVRFASTATPLLIDDNVLAIGSSEGAFPLAGITEKTSYVNLYAYMGHTALGTWLMPETSGKAIKAMTYCLNRNDPLYRQ
jgi:hypothetical protein